MSSMSFISANLVLLLHWNWFHNNLRHFSKLSLLQCQLLLVSQLFLNRSPSSVRWRLRHQAKDNPFCLRNKVFGKRKTQHAIFHDQGRHLGLTEPNWCWCWQFNEKLNQRVDNTSTRFSNNCTCLQPRLATMLVNDLPSLASIWSLTPSTAVWISSSASISGPSLPQRNILQKIKQCLNEQIAVVLMW